MVRSIRELLIEIYKRISNPKWIFEEVTLKPTIAGASALIVRDYGDTLDRVVISEDGNISLTGSVDGVDISNLLIPSFPLVLTDRAAVSEVGTTPVVSDSITARILVGSVGVVKDAFILWSYNISANYGSAELRLTYPDGTTLTLSLVSSTDTPAVGDFQNKTSLDKTKLVNGDYTIELLLAGDGVNATSANIKRIDIVVRYD